MIGDDGQAGKLAIVNTIVAPSIAGIVTFYIRKHITGENKDTRMDFQALTNGILAGLVSVTAGCGSCDPWAGLVIGFLGSFVYCGACRIMTACKIDDPLEAS